MEGQFKWPNIGSTFLIARETLVFQAMLSGPGQYRENEANEIRFKEIPSHVLSKICQYFMYRVSQSTSYF